MSSRERRLAEREGFEPPEPFPVQWFSRPPPSTTRPPLQSLSAGPPAPRLAAFTRLHSAPAASYIGGDLFAAPKQPSNLPPVAKAGTPPGSLRSLALRGSLRSVRLSHRRGPCRARRSNRPISHRLRRRPLRSGRAVHGRGPACRAEATSHLTVAKAGCIHKPADFAILRHLPRIGGISRPSARIPQTGEPRYVRQLQESRNS